MKRWITWNMVTLDSFFAAPDGNLDWFVFDDELERYIKETQPEVGTLLFGRVTYQMMAAYWRTAEGEIATFMNGTEKYVFSRTLQRRLEQDDPRQGRRGRDGPQADASGRQGHSRL